MTPATLLHVEGVTKQFSNTPFPAVDRVTLSLQEGDILGLLGPSGCGKTTLLRLIAGFEALQCGTITLAGRLVAGQGVWIPPEQRDLGMVFQDYALFPHLTVAQNVAFGLKSRKRPGNQRWTRVQLQARVLEVLALVGLEGFQNRYPHALSGGQQQRVALARALAPQPALILMDEPLSNLDVQVRLRLRQEVRTILKQTGTSAIFVTHDQEEAMAIADQVAVMRQGQLEQQGTPEVIYQTPASRFVAEFVTQANFLPAQRQGRLWQTEIGDFTIDPEGCPAAYDCRCVTYVPSQELGDRADLMIRQEDLQLEPDPQGVAIICDRQFLGREQCYRLQTESGQEFYARSVSGSPLAIGTRVRFAWQCQVPMLFPRVGHGTQPLHVKPEAGEHPLSNPAETIHPRFQDITTKV